MKASFIEICEVGGYWCRRCLRYVTVNVSDQGMPTKCERCGTPHLRYDPPVPGFKADEKFVTEPKEAHV